jgi:hypothetical protein
MERPLLHRTSPPDPAAKGDTLMTNDVVGVQGLVMGAVLGTFLWLPILGVFFLR